MRRIVTFLLVLFMANSFVSVYGSAEHGDWDPTEHRSAQGFTITLQGDVLNAYSNKAYENVAIQITDANGVPYYIEETPMTPETPIVIPIDALPAGEYQIYFYTGYELITMHFVKSLNK